MFTRRPVIEIAVTLLLVTGIVTKSLAVADFNAAVRSRCDASRTCCCRATERGTRRCCRRDGESPAPPSSLPAENAPVLKWAAWIDRMNASFVSAASRGASVLEDNHFHAPNARSVQSLFCIWRI
jgi:hypothetical protein